jgi:NAD(P)H-quinone oxidoreductase subunit 5
MQCGLGFFNAAVVHLILHGFYKAHLFLAAGEEIGYAKPAKPVQVKIKPLQAIIVLFFGILGALIFAYLTGKGTAFNSSIFLTLIVAITVGQVTYNIVKEQSLSRLQKIFLPPLLFLCGIVTYAFIYEGVTKLMRDMPMTEVPMSLSFIEIMFGGIFLIGFFVMKLGIYRKSPNIYVKLLNITQPSKKTVLMYKSK